MIQTKIIGFLVTKEKKAPSVDFFNVGINTICIEHLGYNIFLWGTGNIEQYQINGKYALSFPLSESLLDRNVTLQFSDDKIIIENDWLSSIPIFYNKKEGIVSTLSNLCLKDTTIDVEGLSNFCEFGYSVFEHTMFKDVQFLRYYSAMIISNEIKIVYKKDPVLDVDLFKNESNEKDVIDLMQNYVSKVENSIKGDIVIPTSGGFDSRLLNLLVQDKNRIRSFTYGITKKQKESSEVVFAQKLANIYQTRWEQIDLVDFNKHINKWFEIYGYSTHLHGMYHVEFYKKIFQNRNLLKPTFLSGIIGDAWAELGKFKEIENADELINLGYTHGMDLDVKYLKLQSENRRKKAFFNEIGDHLKNDKIKAIFAMRMKLILISYLTHIPEYFGAPVWTPFLNFEIATKTLNIKDVRRENRIWESDLFKRERINLEDMGLKFKKKNSLNYQVLKNTIFDPLDRDLLGKVVLEEKIDKVNNEIKRFSKYSFFTNLFFVPKIGQLLLNLGFKNKKLDTLFEYYVMKSIEKGLKIKK